MTPLFRGMDKAALDAAYNNSLAVADSSQWMAKFDAQSAVSRAKSGVVLGLRYGPAERHLIDYFPAAVPGPVVVFVHGGYWQMRAKESFSFIADALASHGLHTALVGYTLAPGATLAGIVQEVKTALAYLRGHVHHHGGDPACMVLSGWSAGGHLTAMCLDEPGVVAGFAVSGIYDLEPIRLCYINDKLRLVPQDVAPLSPMTCPLSDKPLVVAFGTGELPELQRQSRVFFGLRESHSKPGALLPAEGLNHFTILAALGDANSPLVGALRGLVAYAGPARPS